MFEESDKLCQCCNLRVRTTPRYCTVCTSNHTRMLENLARDLANKAKLFAPSTLAVLSAGITLRRLEDDEAEARDILIRQVQALEEELEVINERSALLADDFSDLQKYVQELETLLKKRVELPNSEIVAEKVHEAWLTSKRAIGVESRQSETGEELMVPYNQLSEAAKDLDRNTVRAVYAAIEGSLK